MQNTKTSDGEYLGHRAEYESSNSLNYNLMNKEGFVGINTNVPVLHLLMGITT